MAISGMRLIITRNLEDFRRAISGTRKRAGRTRCSRFYVPTSAERIGFDISKAGLCFLSGWLIYRGFKPETRLK